MERPKKVGWNSGKAEWRLGFRQRFSRLSRTWGKLKPTGLPGQTTSLENNCESVLDEVQMLLNWFEYLLDELRNKKEQIVEVRGSLRDKWLGWLPCAALQQQRLPGRTATSHGPDLCTSINLRPSITHLDNLW